MDDNVIVGCYPLNTTERVQRRNDLERNLMMKVLVGTLKEVTFNEYSPHLADPDIVPYLVYSLMTNHRYIAARCSIVLEAEELNVLAEDPNERNRCALVSSAERFKHVWPKLSEEKKEKFLQDINLDNKNYVSLEKKEFRRLILSDLISSGDIATMLSVGITNYEVSALIENKLQFLYANPSISKHLYAETLESDRSQIILRNRELELTHETEDVRLKTIETYLLKKDVCVSRLCSAFIDTWNYLSGLRSRKKYLRRTEFRDALLLEVLKFESSTLILLRILSVKKDAKILELLTQHSNPQVALAANAKLASIAKRHKAKQIKMQKDIEKAAEELALLRNGVVNAEESV